jgi:hypothetical protein
MASLRGEARGGTPIGTCKHHGPRYVSVTQPHPLDVA